MSKLPHKKTVITVALMMLAMVGVMEGTGLGEWMAESGMIHLVAIAFVALAIQRLGDLRKLFIGEFEPFFKRLLGAMCLFGITHIFEFAADKWHLIGHDTEPLVVSALYLVSMLLVVAACTSVQGIGKSASDMHAGVSILLACYAAVVAVGLSLGAEEGTLLSFMPLILTLAILGVAVVWVLASMRDVEKKVPVLRLFVRHLQIGTVLVWCSAAVETGFEYLEAAGVRESTIENFAHYLFYAGLLLMYLAFDLPHHFGGLYADVREMFKKGEMPVEEAKA